MRTTLLTKAFITVAALLMAATATAQNSWKATQGARTAAQAAPKAVAEPDYIFLGYTDANSIIYDYDGLSFETDKRVGAAVLITADMLKPYVGGKIAAIYAGWDDRASTSTYEAFVRRGIHGEDVATGTGAVTFGWNPIYVYKGGEEANGTYEITEDGGDLFVGFYTNLKAGVISIPLVYPTKVRNACYLWAEGDVDGEGKEMWFDGVDDARMLPIQLVIEDADGRFHNMLAVRGLYYNGIDYTGKVATATASITNAGSNAISSIEVTSRSGEEVQTYQVDLSKSIQSGDKSNISLPIYCFPTGAASYSISKVNGEPNKLDTEQPVEMITVPEAVAEQYTPHYLIEFYGSENLQLVPKYFEEYVYTGVIYADMLEKVTFLCHHTDDQFMTGDDDAILMMLDLVANDSSQVSLPSMDFNRMCYTSNIAAKTPTGPLFNILYPQAGAMLYPQFAETPTFAAVEISATMDEKHENADIVVKGDIAEGVMLKDEPLYVSAYLVEKNVQSDSQQFWDAAEKAQYGGIYTHHNVIRQILTPIYGEEISNSGAYEVKFQAEIDEDWNADNLQVIAFVNRGLDKGPLNCQIINSAAADVTDPTGISRITDGMQLEARGGSIHADGARLEVYTIDGRKVPNRNLSAGTYIVKASNGQRTAVSKMLVK